MHASVCSLSLSLFCPLLLSPLRCCLVFFFPRNPRDVQRRGVDVGSCSSRTFRRARALSVATACGETAWCAELDSSRKCFESFRVVSFNRIFAMGYVELCRMTFYFLEFRDQIDGETSSWLVVLFCDSVGIMYRTRPGETHRAVSVSIVTDWVSMTY